MTICPNKDFHHRAFRSLVYMLAEKSSAMHNAWDKALKCISRRLTYVTVVLLSVGGNMGPNDNKEASETLGGYLEI